MKSVGIISKRIFFTIARICQIESMIDGISYPSS